MLKSLIKSTNEVRVETEDEADQFHKLLQQEAEKIGCVLSTFTKTLRQKKSKGEVIDEYYQIKYTYVFNDIKEPSSYLKSIEYNLTTFPEEGGVPW
jgi:vacuolar-type H+-ATPase subunit I/STV1